MTTGNIELLLAIDSKNIKSCCTNLLDEGPGEVETFGGEGVDEAGEVDGLVDGRVVQQGAVARASRAVWKFLQLLCDHDHAKLGWVDLIWDFPPSCLGTRQLQ